MPVYRRRMAGVPLVAADLDPADHEEVGIARSRDPATSDFDLLMHLEVDALGTVAVKADGAEDAAAAVVALLRRKRSDSRRERHRALIDLAFARLEVLPDVQ